MPTAIENLESKEIRLITNPQEIEYILRYLLYVPDAQLRPRIIQELGMYIQKKLSNIEYKLQFFVSFFRDIPTGFVICQMDPEYKSYGMKSATFGWLQTSNFESCKILMESCEQYTREQGYKRIRGPINYPKLIGGVGYQVEGHDAPLMNGVPFNPPDMKETVFLQQLGYEPESEYSCVTVVQHTWDRGENLDDTIIIRFLPPDKIRALKQELMELARKSFYSVLADAPGGNSRLDEIFDSYDIMVNYLNQTNKLLNIDTNSYFKNTKYIDAFKTCNPVNIVPCCPIAFDKETGELVGIIMALPNLYQIWKGELLTEMNVDTVMIKKEYSGKGIFSALNNVGQLMVRYCGATYYEGTTIWSNNDRAIKTIFPHCNLRRKHIVFQKRLKK